MRWGKHLKSLKRTDGKLVKRYNTRREVWKNDLRPIDLFKINKKLCKIEANLDV